MKHKWTAWLAWALFALIALVTLYGTWRTIVARGAEPNLSAIPLSLIVIVFALVGALIVSQQPRNTIGWLLLLPTLIPVISALLPDVATMAAPPDPTPLSVWFAVWFYSTNWLLLIIPILLVPLLFPNGSPPSPRWRWVVYYAIGLAVLFVLLITFSHTYVMDNEDGTSWTLTNPLGFIPLSLILEILGVPWSIALGLLAVLCLASLFVRFRRTGAVERQQVKWLLFACGLFAVAYLPPFFMDDNAEDVVTSLVQILFLPALLGFPIAIGIAILRYRLFDIDVIIRRTVTYGVLVAILALVYFGCVVLLQQLFVLLTGQRSEIITILSTLAIAALFVPVRNRLQAWIDQRFNRKKYDAQQVLSRFGETVRDETDLDNLTGELLHVVQETMQPRSVSVWLNTHTDRLPRQDGGL